MADSETEISKEELQKEIAEILQNASLDKTSTKKVIQELEKKLGLDLTTKKKLIDQLVMDYVNSMDSDEDSAEDEPEEVAPPKKMKKETDDDDDERDDSNDSDWGYHGDANILLDGSDEHYRSSHQESTISTSQRRRHIPNRPRKAVILKRVSQQTHEEDECDLFGKLTAKKLRRFPEEQRDSLMIQVNQLFYDKCYGRPTPPTMPVNRQDHVTIASPNVSAARHFTPTQIQAKKIYRVNTIPKLVSSSTNNIPVVPSTSTNVQGQGAPRSNNMPQTVVDNYETVSGTNNMNAGYSCQIM